MALRAARSFTRAFGSARSAAMSVPKNQLGMGLTAATRTFASQQASPVPSWATGSQGKAAAGAKPSAPIAPGPGAEMLERMQALEDTVWCTNWGDYLVLVYDVPFWEAEFTAIQALVDGGSNAEITAKRQAIERLMDCFYACEDVRDHINELLELCTRASGLMGTGYSAGEKVENLDEHATLCGEQYEKLLKTYPEFKPKIEQTVGHGLALLRQKHKFKFSSMHRYFF